MKSRRKGDIRPKIGLKLVSVNYEECPINEEIWIFEMERGEELFGLVGSGPSSTQSISDDGAREANIN